jgi:hypothetical protein
MIDDDLGTIRPHVAPDDIANRPDVADPPRGDTEATRTWPWPHANDVMIRRLPVTDDPPL